MIKQENFPVNNKTALSYGISGIFQKITRFFLKTLKSELGENYQFAGKNMICFWEAMNAIKGVAVSDQVFWRLFYGSAFKK